MLGCDSWEQKEKSFRKSRDVAATWDCSQINNFRGRTTYGGDQGGPAGIMQCTVLAAAALSPDVTSRLQRQHSGAR